MTDKEKMVKLISDTIWRYEPLLKYEPTPTPPGIPSVPEAIADALVAAKFRDTTWKGAIFMNGEAIVPSPDIYNEVAKLLDCPQMLGFEPDVIEVKVRDDGYAHLIEIERDEYMHEYRVARLALRYACQFIGGVTPADIGYNERLFLRRAEKQIDYEEECERRETTKRGGKE